MASFLSPLSPVLSSDTRRGCHISLISSPCIPLNLHTWSCQRRLFLCSSVAERKREASWFVSGRNVDDCYGGWSVVEEGGMEWQKGLRKILLTGTGASVAILLAAFAGCSFSGYKYRFSLPVCHLQRPLVRSSSEAEIVTALETAKADTVSESNAVEVTVNTAISNHVRVEQAEKVVRLVIPAMVDSTQQEALLLLKKLEIIEDNVKSDELCTRREYARWLVKANSMLESSPIHRLAPSGLTAGSLSTAFNDVSTGDPDFWCIQALAEAGIVVSKLTADDSTSEQQKGINFFPESFISRLDLLNWKLLLECPHSLQVDQEMLRKRVEFMDLRVHSSEVPVQLLMDALHVGESIISRVFGRSRRLQPHKPVTKAQAAVALTCGRVMAVIQSEVSRLEMEILSKQAEVESIRSEILLREDTQRFWDERLKEERACSLEVEKYYLLAAGDLEKEKLEFEESKPELLREKGALDCQQQLMQRLKDEVNDVSERLNNERVNLESEQRSLEDLVNDLQAKQEALDTTKATLGAEKEALRILREWVEREAAEIQARAKLFEKAAQRWKWSEPTA